MLRFPQFHFPPLGSTDSVVMLGSCFAEHIANSLKKDGIRVNANPFGVIHNPASVLRLLDRSLAENYYTKNELQYEDRYYFHYEHHSDLANTNQDAYLLEANQRLKELRKSLQKAKYLFLTFGTAWVYTKDGDIVANCHKQDSKFFEKVLLNEVEWTRKYAELIDRITLLNPEILVVFTISPVRYIKDGWQENTVSKGILAQISYNSIKKRDNVFYLPVYEFVTDYLRSYEYYDEDQLHPSPKAIKRVHQLFISSFYDEQLLAQSQEWENLLSALSHKSLKTFSSANLKFKQKLMAQLDAFSKRFGQDVSAYQITLKAEIDRIIAAIEE